MPRSVSCFSVNPSHRPFENKHYTTGIILGMGPTNERRCYIVTSCLVGWPHTQYDPCTSISQISPLYWRHELEKVIDCRESGLEIMIIEATMNKKGLWIYFIWGAGTSSPSHWRQVEEQAPKPVGWMMWFHLMTFVPVQKLCVNIYVYIYIYISNGLCLSTLPQRVLNTHMRGWLQ